MRSLAILIPSYKRPQVLDLTLEGLFNNTPLNDDFKISICIGVNKTSQEEEAVIDKFNSIFKDKSIGFQFILSPDNVGKANILNMLFKKYAEYANLLITMDNDMYISKPWLHLIKQCDVIDYDIMGFSSAKFWAHDPILERCKYIDHGGLRFYTPNSVAGGMMLFHNEFLKRHPWTNHGGVYGRDDASMCLLTNKKYVLGSYEDWLVHDPLVSSTPILKTYEDKKKKLYAQGTTVFKDGWDE